MRFVIHTLNTDTREITIVGDLRPTILPGHVVEIVDGSSYMSLAPAFFVSSVVYNTGLTTITTTAPMSFTPVPNMIMLALHYMVNYSDDTKPPIVVTPYSTNDSTSLSLLGRGVTNYGDFLNANMLHLLEHFSSSTAPYNPTEGQIWYNSSTSTLNVYNGSVWVGVGSSDITSHVSDTTLHLTSTQNTLLDSLTVNATTINYLSGVNSNVQTQINGKESVANKGVANGYASLDAGSKVPAVQLPSYVDDVLEYVNLAGFPVTGETGKIYVAIDTNKTYRWSGSSYIYITSGAVDSVSGKTGVVTLVKADIGLGNVDNTSDASKPVSTAQQTALNLKAALASPTFTGIPTAPTADSTTNTTQIATTAYVKAQGYTSSSGVTSVSGTAPVVSSGGATPAISMAAATASINGYMTSVYATKLDSIATGANNYVHPTGDGNLHVPATGISNNGKVLTAGATAGSLNWTAINTLFLDQANTWTKPQRMAFLSVVSLAGTINLTLNQSTNFNHTLTENTNLDTPLGIVPGQAGVIEFTQSSSVARTLTVSSFWRGVNVVMDTDLGSKHLLSYLIDSTGTFAWCGWQ